MVHTKKDIYILIEQKANISALANTVEYISIYLYNYILLLNCKRNTNKRQRREIDKFRVP